MKKNYATTYNYIADKDYINLYSYLKENHDYSSRLFKYLIRNGKITVNKKEHRFIDEIHSNDKIDIYFPIERKDASSNNLTFKVIYEDEDILIADKPSRMVVHPTHSHQEDTLANAIYYHWDKIEHIGKARFVNRIDMDTTGIVVVAKNKYVHHFLQNQNTNNLINKTYLCITNGCPTKEKGIINAPIARIEESIIERKIDENGKECITAYEVIEKFGKLALVNVKLLTGRTHQIRVHFASIGCPLLGDTLYGTQEENMISRQALHAYKIDFIHPRTKKRLYFTSELPEDFIQTINKIKTMEHINL